MHMQAQERRPRGRPPVVPTLNSTIVSLYASGWTLHEVAAAYGISPCTVRERLIAAGVARRIVGRGLGYKNKAPSVARCPSRIRSAQTAIEVVDLYLHGWSLKAIAEEYDVTPEAIRQRLIRVGVPRRPACRHST